MASYLLKCNLPGNQQNMENMVQIVDPAAVFIEKGKADFRIDITVGADGQKLTCQSVITGHQNAAINFTDEEITDLRYDADAFEQRQKEVVRKAVLSLLLEVG